MARKLHPLLAFVDAPAHMHAGPGRRSCCKCRHFCPARFSSLCYTGETKNLLHGGSMGWKFRPRRGLYLGVAISACLGIATAGIGYLHAASQSPPGSAATAKPAAPIL